MGCASTFSGASMFWWMVCYGRGWEGIAGRVLKIVGGKFSIAI